jgi:hypothetical protein
MTAARKRRISRAENAEVAEKKWQKKKQQMGITWIKGLHGLKPMYKSSIHVIL